MDHDIRRVRGRAHAVPLGEVVGMEWHHRPNTRCVEGEEGGARLAQGVQGEVRARLRAIDASVAQAEEAWFGGPKRAFARGAAGNRVEREDLGLEVGDDGGVRRHRVMQTARILGCRQRAPLLEHPCVKEGGVVENRTHPPPNERVATCAGAAAPGAGAVAVPSPPSTPGGAAPAAGCGGAAGGGWGRTGAADGNGGDPAGGPRRRSCAARSFSASSRAAVAASSGELGIAHGRAPVLGHQSRGRAEDGSRRRRGAVALGGLAAARGGGRPSTLALLLGDVAHRCAGLGRGGCPPRASRDRAVLVPGLNRRRGRLGGIALAARRWCRRRAARALCCAGGRPRRRRAARRCPGPARGRPSERRYRPPERREGGRAASEGLDQLP